MNDTGRQNATIAIWIATTVISLGSLLFSNESWVVSIPLGVALVATLAIWVQDSDKKSGNHKENTTYEPEKRSDNTAYSMALLMEMMDEDEREEFKHNLKQRILSGENVTNESLIMDMEKRKRG
jgi:pyruvoyl-dependent arginine decarboxylase (PvlArgDC)